jgi:long-chain acyl-CoA synthetase
MLYASMFTYHIIEKHIHLSSPVTPRLSRQDAIVRLTAPGEPYELEPVMLNGHPCRVFRRGPQTLRALYAETRSDATFWVYEDERYSFEDMYRGASRIASVLVARFGIAPGDHVAISMRNYPEWMTAFCAITSIGAVAVAMNALWQPDEMAYALHDSGARVLFADQERIERFARTTAPPGVAVIAVRPSRSLPAGVADLAELLRDAPSVAMPDVAVAPDDDATILYTSGSTGHPKGAVSTHRNVISALLSWELDVRIDALRYGWTPRTASAPQYTALLTVPLFHVAGLHAVALAAFRGQRKVVSMYRWDVQRALELIERERVSQVVGPAAITGDLVAAARQTTRDLSSLAVVGGGGAPRAPAQVRDIARTFGRAMPNTGWGMTETNAIGTGIGGAEYLERPGSAGVCSAVLDLAIVDEQGRPVPPGQRGELRVRGASVIRGYHNRPDANAATFEDGWLKTGDIAYLDEDGYLYIVDRLKDLVIRGGENIGCGEVEAALLEHPNVLEACVYGVPDERLGEEVGATVYADADLDADALRAFLGDRLAAFKIPRYIRIVREQLDRGATGKIDKRRLRAVALTELGGAA